MASRDPNFYKITLKSWLYERINQGEGATEQEYLGLEWIDKEKLMFKLPWVTESDPNWQRYYKLFHHWASRFGEESRDSQKAKRNFRSALNHSKHFELIKDKGKELQTGSYKVYKFVTEEELRSQKQKQRNISKDSSSSQSTTLPESQNYLLQQGVQVYGENGNIANDPNMQQPYQVDEQYHTLHGTEEVPMDTTGVEDMQLSIEDSLGLVRGKLAQVGITAHNESRCNITVEYNGRQQCTFEILLAPSCKVKYGDFVPPGEDHYNTLLLESVDHMQNPGLNKILENMKRGLIFEYDTNTLSFYMKRECLAHVYCFNMHEEREPGFATPNPGFPLQIQKKRERPYLMFSYKHYVNEWLERNIDPTIQNSMLSSRIEIIVGVQPRPDQRGKPVKGVKITLQIAGADLIANCEDPLLVNDVKTSLASMPDFVTGGHDVFVPYSCAFQSDAKLEMGNYHG